METFPVENYIFFYLQSKENRLSAKYVISYYHIHVKRFWHHQFMTLSLSLRKSLICFFNRKLMKEKENSNRHGSLHLQKKKICPSNPS